MCLSGEDDVGCSTSLFKPSTALAILEAHLTVLKQDVLPVSFMTVLYFA